jgi:hypothetical protein
MMKKKKWRRRDCSPGHKLNIINDNITDRFYRQVNFVNYFIYINDMLLYILTFLTFFFTVILSIYNERIFSSVFTDGYNERLFYK